MGKVPRDIRVLYNLPQVIAATVVIVVEGEKDADNVQALGLCDAGGNAIAATCNSFGAASAAPVVEAPTLPVPAQDDGKWLAEYSDVLVGKRVVILFDRDLAGMNHAFGAVKASIEQVFEKAAVERAVAGEPAPGSAVKVVDIASIENEKGWDVSDYVKAHGDNAANDLVETINAQIGADWLALPATPIPAAPVPAPVLTPPLPTPLHNGDWYRERGQAVPADVLAWENAELDIRQHVHC